MKKLILTLSCVAITLGVFAQSPTPAAAPAPAPATTQKKATPQKATTAKKDSTSKKAAPAKSAKTTPAKPMAKEPEGTLVPIAKNAPPEYCCREKVCNFCSKEPGTCPQHKKDLILEGTYYCPGDDGFDVTSDKEGKCPKCGKDLVKFDKSDRKVYRTKEKPAPAPAKKSKPAEPAPAK